MDPTAVIRNNISHIDSVTTKILLPSMRSSYTLTGPTLVVDLKCYIIDNVTMRFDRNHIDSMFLSCGMSLCQARIIYELNTVCYTLDLIRAT